MLLNAAIGDAYGSGYEFAPDFVFEKNTLQSYLIHADASGYFNRYTDDTQMAIGIAELLVEKADWTPLNIAQKFVDVFKRDIRVGYAGRFYEFLKMVKDGEEFLEKIRPHSERNGASMRAFPMGILATEKEVLEKAEIQARVTHNTNEGVFSAQVVALSAHYFLYKKGARKDVEDYLKSYIPIDWNFDWKGKVLMQGRQGILAALSAIQRYDKLSNILIESIDYQGDVDTVATLSMAIGTVCDEVENDLPDWCYENLENGKFGRDFIAELNRKLLGLGS